MAERPGAITMKGDPLTLIGDDVRVGDKAPDVTVVDGELQEVRLADRIKGGVSVILSVPSLDTSVCDAEVRRFNEKAAGLGRDVTVLTVSMDLPFAQQRWCGAADIDRVETVSDYRYAAFGQAFGVLIKELRLLARAVWVVDGDGVVRYTELVKEVADEPDYEAALNAVDELT